MSSSMFAVWYSSCHHGHLVNAKSPCKSSASSFVLFAKVPMFRSGPRPESRTGLLWTPFWSTQQRKTRQQAPPTGSHPISRPYSGLR